MADEEMISQNYESFIGRVVHMKYDDHNWYLGVVKAYDDEKSPLYSLKNNSQVPQHCYKIVFYDEYSDSSKSAKVIYTVVCSYCELINGEIAKLIPDYLYKFRMNTSREVVIVSEGRDGLDSPLGVCNQLFRGNSIKVGLKSLLDFNKELVPNQTLKYGAELRLSQTFIEAIKNWSIETSSSQDSSDETIDPIEHHESPISNDSASRKRDLYSVESSYDEETSAVFHKNLKKKLCWTEEEDDQLISLLSQFGTKPWSRIGNLHSTRDAKQCRYRWNIHLVEKTELNQSSTPEEINALRMTSSSRLRWLNHFDPNLAWTIEEDRIILQMQREGGNRWASMSNLLPGRDTVRIRDRFNALKQRIQRFVDLCIEEDQLVTEQDYNIEHFLRHPLRP